jgi:hypothetical protein
MSDEPIATHEELLRGATERMAFIVNGLLMVLKEDAGPLLLAACAECLERTYGRDGTAKMLRIVAMRYEGGGGFDATTN